MSDPNCAAYQPANVTCPVEYDAVLRSVCLAHPNGWAWASVDTPGTRFNGLARAFATMLHDVVTKACGLLPEFRCHTADETLDDWNTEYGLPDDCGINDLCAKVRATGGQSCDYFTDLAELLGYTTFCCEEVPTEIMTGCWNLGCDPMPPPSSLRYGGCDLGHLGLACPPKTGGSPLGQGTLGSGDCNIAGYHVADANTVSDDSECRTDSTCERWHRPQTGELITGCYTPEEMAPYEGTAFHWRYGMETDDPIFGRGDVTMTGCWDMGCDELCGPQLPHDLCWIARYKPAHTVAVPIWCDL